MTSVVAMAPLPVRYHPVSMLLHWAMALGIVAATVMAFRMVEIPGITPLKLRLFNYHKWLGVCLWGLLLVRLAWRLLTPPPALPPALPAWQQSAAAAGHVALYALMLAIPVLGYLYSLAAGYPVVLFGVWPLPVILAPDPELKDALKAAHLWSNRLLWAVLLMHVGAALKHWLVDRDGIMQRMLPRWFGSQHGQRGSAT